MSLRGNWGSNCASGPKSLTGQVQSFAKGRSEIGYSQLETSVMPLPSPVRFARNGLVVWLGLISLYLAYRFVREPLPVVGAIAIAYLLAAAGLARGMEWGRALCSFCQLLVTPVACVLFLGDMDARQNTTVVESWLGHGLPLWINWAFLMLFVCALLAPLAIVGGRRSYFRSGLW